MARALGVMLVVGLLAGSALAASAARPRLTQCYASTFIQAGRGTALFKGNCNGKDTSLKADPGSVKGRVGGMATMLRGTGATYTGRIGQTRTRLELHGATITGRYGAGKVKFAIVGYNLTGRVGALHVACSIKLLSPLGELISCSGARGGAQVLVPLIVKLYAAP